MSEIFFIFEEIQMSGVFASEIHHFPARKRNTASPGGGLPEENFIEFFVIFGGGKT
jgi:hypothetical protein